MTTLTMTRGASAQWDIPITLSGVPDPLPEGAVITWTATQRVGEEPVLVKTSADGIVILDAEEGLAQLQIDAIDTLVLPADRDTVLAWDVWLTIDAEQWQLASGPMRIRASARRFA